MNGATALRSAIVTGTIRLAMNCVAHAGGLEIREQSAQFQGSSFSGNGAGGGLSLSFWNSAAISSFEGAFQSESHGTIILGRTEFSADAPHRPPYWVVHRAQRIDDPTFVCHQVIRLTASTKSSLSEWLSMHRSAFPPKSTVQIGKGAFITARPNC